MRPSWPFGGHGPTRHSKHRHAPQEPFWPPRTPSPCGTTYGRAWCQVGRCGRLPLSLLGNLELGRRADVVHCVLLDGCVLAIFHHSHHLKTTGILTKDNSENHVMCGGQVNHTFLEHGLQNKGSAGKKMEDDTFSALSNIEWSYLRL